MTFLGDKASATCIRVSMDEVVHSHAISMYLYTFLIAFADTGGYASSHILAHAHIIS